MIMIDDDYIVNRLTGASNWPLIYMDKAIVNLGDDFKPILAKHLFVLTFLRLMSHTSLQLSDFIHC